MQSTNETSHLAKQQFYLIDFDHRSDKNLNTTKNQVDFLIDKFTKMLSDGCGKIAIIYSAHNDQAIDLYTHYRCGDKIDRDISGHGQAVLFKPLIKELYNKKLDDRVKILPVATTMKGGGYHPVNESEIIRDMANVISHLDSEYHVIVLKNPETKVRKRGQRYLIGGGVADGFYSNSEHRLYFHDMPLTHGRYVEKVLDFLSVAYGGGITADVQKNMLQDLKRALSPYQSMALTPTDDVMFSFLTPRPLSLVHYITRGLVKRYLLPSSHLGLVNVTFDNQLNLLVSCDDEPLCERISSSLAQYRARVVSHKSKEHSPFVFQIDAEHVIDFCLKYCKVSADDTRYFYAHELSKFLKNFVVIIPNGIIYQSQKYNAQQFASAMTNSSISRVALFSLEKICVLPTRQTSKSYYRYNPIFKANSDKFSRSFLGVTRDINRLGGVRCEKLDTTISSMIFWHYDLMTRRACQFFKTINIDDIVNQNAGRFVGIGNYFTELVKLVRDDLFAINHKSHENLDRGFYKFWLYVQVTHLAFQRGNMFIAFTLMSALTGCYAIFSPYLDAQTKHIYDQLNTALCASLQFEHLRKIIGESTYFQHHYGASLPPIVFYLMWMDNGVVTAQSTERTFMIIERLNPILSELSTLTLPHQSLDFYQPKGSDRVEFVRLRDKHSATQLKTLCSNLEQYSVRNTIQSCVKEIRSLLSPGGSKQGVALMDDITQRYDVFSGQLNIFTDLLVTGRLDLIETALKHCLFRSNLLSKRSIDFVIDSEKDPILKFKLKECIRQYLSTERNMQVTCLVANNQEDRPQTVIDRDSILIFDVNSFIPADPLLQLIQQRIGQSSTMNSSSVMLLAKADIVEYVKSGVNPNVQTRMKLLIQDSIPNLQNGSTLLIPININNMHFTTLAIRKNQYGMLSALYIDTFGDYGQTASVIEKMCKRMGGINLSTYCVNYQSNNDCAVHVELNCAIVLHLKDEHFNAPCFETAMKNLQLDDQKVMTRKRLLFAERVINLPDISDYFQEIAITERLATNGAQNQSQNSSRFNKSKRASDEVISNESTEDDNELMP